MAKLFGHKPTCMKCNCEIKGGDKVYVEMIYPKRKGFTEIKAYLELEGKFICEECYKFKEKTKTQFLNDC